MGFSRQGYWSGLPCPPPADLSKPGIEFASLKSPALAGKLFTTWEVLDFHRHAKILERIFVYLSSSYASDII